jgi:hypothetical protein
MNTSLTPMGALPTARHRRWPWALVATALLLIVLSLLAAVVLAGFIDGAREGFQLTVDDDSFLLLPAGFEAGFGTVVGLMLAILAVVVVVPLTLLLAGLVVVTVLALVALAVATGLAAAAAAVLLALALVTSPLWGLVLLMWWLLRRPPRAAPA